jgi:CRP/FNR family cyclic AMP-dependent transcriptional regulator
VFYIREGKVKPSLLSKQGKEAGYVIERPNRTQADLVDQLFNSSEKRLARTLLILSRVGKENQTETVILRVSQETLAEMIGTTRSRVNFSMNKFRKLGFIASSTTTAACR